MIGLFPEIEIVEPPPRKRRPNGDLRRPTKQKGHYAAPGSGPAGETCGTCRFRTRIQLSSKSVYKCERARKWWTSSLGSDIRLKDLACGGWRKEEP